MINYILISFAQILDITTHNKILSKNEHKDHRRCQP